MGYEIRCGCDCRGLVAAEEVLGVAKSYPQAGDGSIARNVERSTDSLRLH